MKKKIIPQRKFVLQKKVMALSSTLALGSGPQGFSSKKKKISKKHILKSILLEVK
jgi:hypothetical protein